MLNWINNFIVNNIGYAMVRVILAKICFIIAVPFLSNFGEFSQIGIHFTFGLLSAIFILKSAILTLVLFLHLVSVALLILLQKRFDFGLTKVQIVIVGIFTTTLVYYTVENGGLYPEINVGLSFKIASAFNVILTDSKIIDQADFWLLLKILAYFISPIGFMNGPGPNFADFTAHTKFVPKKRDFRDYFQKSRPNLLQTAAFLIIIAFITEIDKNLPDYYASNLLRPTCVIILATFKVAIIGNLNGLMMKILKLQMPNGYKDNLELDSQVINARKFLFSSSIEQIAQNQRIPLVKAKEALKTESFSGNLANQFLEGAQLPKIAKYANLQFTKSLDFSRLDDIKFLNKGLTNGLKIVLSRIIFDCAILPTTMSSSAQIFDYYRQLGVYLFGFSLLCHIFM